MTQFKVTRTKHVKESFVVEADDCESALRLTEGEDREEVIRTEQHVEEYLRLPDSARRMEKMDAMLAQALRSTGLGGGPLSSDLEQG